MIPCPLCGAPLEDMGPDFLDQCGLTRLPARQWRCVKCPEEVTETLATGERWEPYPSALPDSTKAIQAAVDATPAGGVVLP